MLCEGQRIETVAKDTLEYEFSAAEFQEQIVWLQDASLSDFFSYEEHDWCPISYNIASQAPPE